MYRKSRTSGRTRKLLIGAAAAALVGGVFAVSTGLSSAGTAPSGPRENCAGLDAALKGNLDFVAGQRANPDAQSKARIANRQAVIDQINQRRAVAGCTGGAQAQPPAAKPPAQAPANPPAAGNGNAGNTGGAGEVVCKGSTVTLSGEGGAPAASSNTFPVGTTLKVTNLDNNKSTTVKVASASGSCVLLNNAAFEQVREAGKFLIRRAVIERVGAAAKPPAQAPANPPAAGNGNGNAGNTGEVVCKGSTVTLSGEGGAPAASSGTFPIGTTLKVTNLDNNKSTTVKVASTSGSCVLLNNAAFEQVREAGKFLIRRAVIERVG
ncbi:hypothetical protein [Actinoplanes sp. NPDC026623]|uniref:hypothetical protein n=1 Tax=Actinoplanes sp. NPDC026623 TaxID=3155610 RepID=UPI0033CF8203